MAYESVSPRAPEDLLYAVVIVFLLVLHALLIAWHALPTRLCVRIRFCNWRACCLKRSRDAVARVRGWMTKRASEAEPAPGENYILETLVNDAMRAKRQRFMRAVGHGASIVEGSFLVTILYSMYTRDDRWLTPAQTILTCCWYPLTWCLSMRRLNFTALRLCAFLQFLGMGMFVVASPPDIGAVIFSMVCCSVVRFIFSVFMMDKWLACFANGMCSLMVLVALFRADAPPPDMIMLKPANVFFCEFTNSLTISLVASAFQEAIEVSSRQAIELQSSRNESLAAVGVLKAVCDAVVRLDDEMLVADRETKLAALLLHGPGRVLNGSDFVQYLHTEELQVSFREWLKISYEVDKDKGGYESLLRDSTGNAIKVEMFHVPFEIYPGMLHHFIGICEKGSRDEDQANHEKDSFPVQEREDLPVIEKRSESRSENRSENRNENRSETSGLSAVSDFLGDDQCVSTVPEIDSRPTLKFDPKLFKVLGSSAGFMIGPHGPPRRGTFLSDRMRKCDTNDNFFREFASRLSRLLRHAQTTAEPVDVDYAAAMLYSPEGSKQVFRLTLRVILASTWRDTRPVVSSTAVLLAFSSDPARSDGSRRRSSVRAQSGSSSGSSDNGGRIISELRSLSRNDLVSL